MNEEDGDLKHLQEHLLNTSRRSQDGYSEENKGADPTTFKIMPIILKWANIRKAQLAKLREEGKEDVVIDINKLKKKDEPIKAKKETWLQAFINFIVFIFEFILATAIIMGGLFFSAIPSAVYTVLNLIYIGLQVGTSISSIYKRFAISVILIVLSTLVIIGKSTLIILMGNGSFKYDKELFLSLGVSITPQDKSFGLILETYEADVICLIASLISALFLYYLYLKNPPDEEELQNEWQIHLGYSTKKAYSHKFWCFFSLLLLCCTSIVVPSFIALFYSVMAGICLYLWGWGWKIEEFAFKFTATLTIGVSYLYLVGSFVMRIEYLIEILEGSWQEIVGFTAFDKSAEVMVQYALILLQYIACLMYFKMKQRAHLKQTAKATKKKKEACKNLFKKLTQVQKHKRKNMLRKKIKKNKTKQQIMDILESPYLYLMIVRLGLFFWLYRYFCFPSAVPLIYFMHSTMYVAERLFFAFCGFVYIPLLFAIYIGFYVINIPGLIPEKNFNERKYRYGLFNFDRPYEDLFYILTIVFLCCLTQHMFYRMEVIKARRERIKNERRNSEKLKKLKDQTVTLIDVVVRFLITKLDILIMVFLYLAGTNNIDIYHMSLAVYFALFAIWPHIIRNHFLYFYIYIAAFTFEKYFYLLFKPEFEERQKLKEWFDFIGLSQSNDELTGKYFRAELLNTNYALILLCFIQYRIYTSDIYHETTSPEYQKKQNRYVYKHHPKLSKFIVVMSHLVAMLVPWVTYFLFVLIATLNNNSIINWTYLVFSLVLLFWHLSSDMVTAVSHKRILWGWNVFIIYAVILFFVQLTYQLLCVKLVAGWLEGTVEKLVPEFVIKNIDIIGLENYTDKSPAEIAIKFIAYVAYLNLSVFTRRQIVASHDTTKKMEAGESVEEGGEPRRRSSISRLSELAAGTQINLVYFVFQLRYFWPLIDFVAKYFFILVTITIISLSLFWQVSLAMYIYVIFLMIYYFSVSRGLTPQLKQDIQYGDSIDVKDGLDIVEHEKKTTSEVEFVRRKYTSTFILLFTVIFITILYLSENLEILKERYPSQENFYDLMIYVTFLCGVNHSEATPVYSFAYSCMGYYIVLIMMGLERKAEVWQYCRFGCDEEEYIQRLETQKRRERHLSNVSSQLRSSINSSESEEEKGDRESDYKSIKRRSIADSFYSAVLTQSIVDTEAEKDSKLQTRIKERTDATVVKLLAYKYTFGLMKAFRYIVYTTVVLLSLLSAAKKSNLMALIILIGLCFNIFRAPIYSTLKHYNYFLICIVIIQYGLILSNLTEERSSPMQYPKPYTVHYGPFMKDPPIPIPWYTHFEFLVKEDNKWAYYLTLMISKKRNPNMWYEWGAILVMNLYFILFNSVLYDQNVKLTAKKSLIKSLVNIADEEQRKANAINIISKGEQQNQINVKMSGGLQRQNTDVREEEEKKGDDDQIEDPLLTHQISEDELEENVRKGIEEIDRQMLIQKLYSGLCNAVYSTSHIISLVILLIIALQQYGLISLFYIGFCLYNLYNSKNFIYQRGWIQPRTLTKILKKFVFIDIFIQILYQLPVDILHKSDLEPEAAKSSWQNAIGIYYLWDSDGNANELNITNLKLKCVMFAFVLLQEDIFKSKTFRKFVITKLPALRLLSDLKGRIQAYLFNNHKIKKIVKIQYEKKSLQKKLAVVSKQLLKWNSMLSPDEAKDEDQKAFKSKEKMQQKVKEMKSGKKVEPIVEEAEEQEPEGSAFDEPEKAPSISDKHTEIHDPYQEQKERDQKILDLRIVNDGIKSEKKILKLQMAKNATFFEKVYVWVRQNFVNNVLMLNDYPSLIKMQQMVYEGGVIIYTRIENVMIQDYQEETQLLERRLRKRRARLRHRDLKSEASDARMSIQNESEESEGSDGDQFQDPAEGQPQSPKDHKVSVEEELARLLPEGDRNKHLKQFRTPLSWMSEICSTIFLMFLSNTHIIVYCFMIICHIVNASLLSVMYPIAVFAYALFEETRPTQKFWRWILVYSTCCIFLKFLFNVYPIKDQLAKNEEWNHLLKTYRIGLHLVEREYESYLNMFLCEILVMLSTTFHQFILIIQGVWERNEEKIESIELATQRIFNEQQRKKREQEEEERLANAMSVGSNDDRSAKSQLPLCDQDVLDNQFEFPVMQEEKKEFVRPRTLSFDQAWMSKNEKYDMLGVREKMAKIKKKKKKQYIDQLDETEVEMAYEYESEEEDPDLVPKYTEHLSKFPPLLAPNEDPQVPTKEYFELDEHAGEDQVPVKKVQLKRALTQHYTEPTPDSLRDFVLDQQAGGSRIKKIFGGLTRFMRENDYFKRLFPQIKEQKPGRDVYIFMAFFQFVSVLFLIVFYTKMDRDYSNSSADLLETNQFSGLMVIAVFLQIIIIILDRYLYLAKTFVVIEEVEVEDEGEVEYEEFGAAKTASLSDLRTESVDLRTGSSSSILQKKLKSASLKTKKASEEEVQVSEAEAMRDAADKDEEKPEAHHEETEIKLQKTDFNKAIVLKYYLQWVSLIFIHIALFWYLPNKGNQILQGHGWCDLKDLETAKDCNEFPNNLYLILFYLFQCGYFFFSAQQIRFGLPELRKGNFAMQDTGPMNKYIFQGYLAVPFLMELKVITDWTFTRTSLDLFQWLKFEGVYGDLFIAKCTNKAYLQHKLGEAMPGFKKFFMGFVGIVGIVILLAGPLLIFSSLNPVANNNNVEGATITLNMVVKDGGIENTYQLFKNDHVQYINVISDDQYNKLEFGQNPNMRNFDKSTIQTIALSRFADQNWDITVPNQEVLFEAVGKVKDGAADAPQVEVQLLYTFSRPEPPGQQLAQKHIEKVLSMEKLEPMVNALHYALDPSYTCDQPPTDVIVPSFYIPTVRLGQDGKPKLINIPELLTNLKLTRACDDSTTDVRKDFWFVAQDKFSPDGSPENGVVWFTVSDKVTPGLASYSPLTFYVSIVLVIGRVLRAVIATNSDKLFITEMPRPDRLLILCEGVLISRLERKLEREEELYYVLIDIMRSPQFLHQITTSSLRKKKED